MLIGSGCGPVQVDHEAVKQEEEGGDRGDIAEQLTRLVTHATPGVLAAAAAGAARVLARDANNTPHVPHALLRTVSADESAISGADFEVRVAAFTCGPPCQGSPFLFFGCV